VIDANDKAKIEYGRDFDESWVKMMNSKPIDTPYRAGFNAGMHGPTTFNCHYTWFSTAERTAEWGRGKKDGEKAQRAATPGPRETKGRPV
jgi:hypothetical protein